MDKPTKLSEEEFNRVRMHILYANCTPRSWPTMLTDLPRLLATLSAKDAELEHQAARIADLEGRFKEAGEYAVKFVGCRCDEGESEPGDCWPCRMVTVIGILSEPPEPFDPHAGHIDEETLRFLENL